jgi:hypothetical protein
LYAFGILTVCFLVAAYGNSCNKNCHSCVSRNPEICSLKSQILNLKFSPAHLLYRSPLLRFGGLGSTSRYASRNTKTSRPQETTAISSFDSLFPIFLSAKWCTLFCPSTAKTGHL